MWRVCSRAPATTKQAHSRSATKGTLWRTRTLPEVNIFNVFIISMFWQFDLHESMYECNCECMNINYTAWNVLPVIARTSLLIHQTTHHLKTMFRFSANYLQFNLLHFRVNCLCFASPRRMHKCVLNILWGFKQGNH